jgi:hypothetical protein
LATGRWARAVGHEQLWAAVEGRRLAGTGWAAPLAAGPWAIKRVHADFLAETLTKVEILTSTIEQIKENHIVKLRAIGGSDAEIESVRASGQTGTIRERHMEVQSNFDKFWDTVYTVRSGQFAQLQRRILVASHQLGIDDRAFAEVDEDDMGPEKLARFQRKASELDDDLERRSNEFLALEQEISRLSRDLQEETPREVNELFFKQEYSAGAFERVTGYLQTLNELFETRRRYISEMAVEIKSLWDLLKVDDSVRRQFMDSHTVLSEKNVEDCRAEAQRLTQLRNQRLPYLIQLMKTDIRHIGTDLSYDAATMAEIYSRCDEGSEDGSLERFNSYEAELLHLKKLHIAGQPIIELIKQREEIIEEYHEATAAHRENAPPKAKETPRTRPPEPTDRLRIEKATRRYKMVLPRVNKKLKAWLLRFKEEDGADFLWKGKPIIDELEDVQVPPSEQERVRKTTRGSADRDLLTTILKRKSDPPVRHPGLPARRNRQPPRRSS